MNKREETPVFPMSVNPVREGVYKLHGKTLEGKPFRWAHWKDREWKSFQESRKDAETRTIYRSSLAYTPFCIQGWSGLMGPSK